MHVVGMFDAFEGCAESVKNTHVRCVCRRSSLFRICGLYFGFQS